MEEGSHSNSHSAGTSWNGSSFAKIAAAKAGAKVNIVQKVYKEQLEDEEWDVDEALAWKLDIEEDVFGDDRLQPNMKKKGKKGQTLVISNSSGRRRQ